MARIVGKFMDKGREWFAKTLAGIQYAPDALVFLRNEGNGLVGNVAITHTLAAVGFHVSGMAGGADPASPAPDGAPATGTILAVPGISINDGETFYLSDGSDAFTFEFDKDTIITPGNISVPIDDTMTAADVAQAIMNAVNGVNLLDVVASFITPDEWIELLEDRRGWIPGPPQSPEGPDQSR